MTNLDLRNVRSTTTDNMDGAADSHTGKNESKQSLFIYLFILLIQSVVILGSMPKCDNH